MYVCSVGDGRDPSEEKEKGEEMFVSHTFQSEQALMQAFAQSEAAAEGQQMDPHSDCGPFTVTLTFARFVARLKSEGGVGGPPPKPEGEAEGGGGGEAAGAEDEVAQRVEDALTLNYKLKKSGHPNLPYLIADCSPILIVETETVSAAQEQEEVGQVIRRDILSMPSLELEAHSVRLPLQLSPRPTPCSRRRRCPPCTRWSATSTSACCSRDSCTWRTRSGRRSWARLRRRSTRGCERSLRARSAGYCKKQTRPVPSSIRPPMNWASLGCWIFRQLNLLLRLRIQPDAMQGLLT